MICKRDEIMEIFEPDIKDKRGVGILELALGIIFLISGLINFANAMTNHASRATIMATVTDIHVIFEGDEDEIRCYYVTYTYNDVTYENVSFGSNGRYSLGDEVAITINPQKPEIPRGFSSDYNVAAFLVIAGFVLITISWMKANPKLGMSNW